jgi:5-formyltetrahydrofolate cyclo-ligase
MNPQEPSPSGASRAKADLRHTLRLRRRNLDQAHRAEAARAVAKALDDIPDWRQLQRIALYLAADGELDPGDIACHCRALGRSLYLPRVDSRGTMTFALWREGTVLERNRYGIPEPPASAPQCDAAGLDLLFLPLVGWDRRGNRLGMGGGYYDRALAGARDPATGRPLLVGLAFGLQEVPSLPVQDWDIRLDFVLTEAGLQPCAAGRRPPLNPG